MMPVPPPKILELGTAVAFTPLKVTLVTLALVDVLFSQATPMITNRSVPLPSVWDQEREDIEVVEAVRLAASKVIDAFAVAGRNVNAAIAKARAATRGRENRGTNTLPIRDIFLSLLRVDGVECSHALARPAAHGDGTLWPAWLTTKRLVLVSERHFDEPVGYQQHVLWRIGVCPVSWWRQHVIGSARRIAKKCSQEF